MTQVCHVVQQLVHGSGKKAVSQPFGSCVYGSEPAWGKGGEQGVPGVWGVSHDVRGLFAKTAQVDVSQVWEWGADDPLSSFDYPLQVFPVCRSTTRVPDYTAVYQDALNCAAVEVDWQFLGESFFLRTSGSSGSSEKRGAAGPSWPGGRCSGSRSGPQIFWLPGTWN